MIMQKLKYYLTSVAFAALISSSVSASALVAEWSFNAEASPTAASINNTGAAATVTGGFIGLGGGFGPAVGKTIGSPGDLATAPDIGGTLNNNAMGRSGSRSVLDTAGAATPSGDASLGVFASTAVYSGLTVSWHQSVSYLGSRYYQLEVTTDGTTFAPVSGGIGSSALNLGINGQTSTSATIDASGLITHIADIGTVPSTSNGDGFVYELSYEFTSGAWDNNPNFGFQISAIHDPSGSDYVSSGTGELFGAASGNGYTRTSLYYDSIQISAAVPEPSMLASFIGLAALGMVIRRRRRS